MHKLYSKISLPKLFLLIVIIISVGLVFGTIKSLKKIPRVTPTPAPQVNKIEISADKKSIIDAETKKLLFKISEAQNYIKDYFKNRNYEYAPGKFIPITDARYAGDCFGDAALSNDKELIVFSTSCIDDTTMDQPWIGTVNHKLLPLMYEGETAPESRKFLSGGFGQNFTWSSDDNAITYETPSLLSLPPSLEKRTIDSQTGEILERKNTPVTSNSEIKGLSAITLPTDLKSIIFELAKKDYIRDYKGMDSCGNKEITMNDYQYGFEATDLNNDGLKEFIIEPMGFCDPTTFRGAQGNGAYDLFEKKNGLWKNIGGINGNRYQILERKTDGYFDIVTTWHLGAASVGLTYYKWQKQEMTYKTMFTKDIELQENSDFDQEVNNFIKSQNN